MGARSFGMVYSMPKGADVQRFAPMRSVLNSRATIVPRSGEFFTDLHFLWVRGRAVEE